MNKSFSCYNGSDTSCVYKSVFVCWWLYTLANERYQQSQHGQPQKSVDPCPLVSSAKIRFVQFLLIISYLIGISAWKCTSYIYTIRYGREIIETFWMFQFLKTPFLDKQLNTTSHPVKLIRQSMGIEMHLLYFFT